MTLSEFLLARIAEKERIGRILERSSAGGGTILAECEAVRRIVEEHRSIGGGACSSCYTNGAQDEWRAADWPCFTMCILASVYSDHPDYDEAWRA